MKSKVKKNAQPGAWIVNPEDRGRRPIKKGNVYLENGEEFEIELFNPLKTNILADIRINGDSISEGGLILKPGRREYLDCFVDDGRKFKFDTYKVEDSKEAKEATSNNGVLEIVFYKEDVLKYSGWNNRINLTPPTVIREHHWYPYRPSVPYTYPNIWYGGTYGNSGAFGGTTTITTTVGSMGTLESGSFGVSSDDIGMANSQCYSASLSADIETGRVEKGDESSQTFTTIDMDFEETQIHSITYKLLPVSQQPLEVKKTKKVKNDDINSLLTNLWELTKEGILTEKEFSDKKKELLSRI